MGSLNKKGRLRITNSRAALAKLGLPYFQAEDEPEASLLRALLTLAERRKKADNPAAGLSSLDDASVLPDEFIRLHSEGVITRRFLSQSNDEARFGLSVYGAIWSPGLRVGVFAWVDYDGEMLSAIDGFSYEEPLHFTKKSLKPVAEVIRDEYLGAAAGIQRISNYSPDLFPESLFVDSYLSSHKECFAHSADPFVLIYKEYHQGGEVNDAT